VLLSVALSRHPPALHGLDIKFSHNHHLHNHHVQGIASDVWRDHKWDIFGSATDDEELLGASDEVGGLGSEAYVRVQAGQRGGAGWWAA
jgi:hypothetical protein